MARKLTFTPTEIEDVLTVEGPLFEDDRGYFCEVYNRKAWAAEGFEHRFVQDNMSQSRRGTLRGLHYQLEPHGMGKYVRVLRGSVFDVAVDLRQGSPAFGKWVGRTLSAANGMGLWIPSGFAHGFLAIEDETVVLYKCTSTYEPSAERAIAYNDPDLAIAWPETPSVISPKDADAPLFRDAEYNFTFTL